MENSTNVTQRAPANRAKLGLYWSWNIFCSRNPHCCGLVLVNDFKRVYNNMTGSHVSKRD